MLRIAVVGDLSLQDPARLRKAMTAALLAKPDLLVHVGDIHPGYEVILDFSKGKVPIYAVPGNHDTEWDTKLGMPRQWVVPSPAGKSLAYLIGLDNSKDTFNDYDWTSLPYKQLDIPIILFVHKPLSTILLPDGSESTHTMLENGPNKDAERLKQWAVMTYGDPTQRKEVLFVHGHYHGWTLMKTGYGDCLIEGRGGAAPELGYSIITVREEGIAIHQATVY